MGCLQVEPTNYGIRLEITGAKGVIIYNGKSIIVDKPNTKPYSITEQPIEATLNAEILLEMLHGKVNQNQITQSLEAAFGSVQIMEKHCCVF